MYVPFHQGNRVSEKRGGSFKGTWRERPEICRTAESVSGKGNTLLDLKTNICVLEDLSHFYTSILTDFRAWKQTNSLWEDAIYVWKWEFIGRQLSKSKPA